MAKRIDFENGYVVDIDPMNWTLKKDIVKTMNEEGEECERSTFLGHLPSLRVAIKDMAEDMTRTQLKSFNTIAEVAEIARETDRKIDKILEQFGSLG